MADHLYQPSDIRNIALVGHGFSGKTSLGEAMLFNTGATSRLGSTTAGNGTLDFEPEEQKRGGSIATSLAWVEHDGKKINILDTPGDGNFIFDAFTAMRGADTAVIVVSCPDGVEVQTERVYHEAVNLGIPRVMVINKMDRERADYRAVLDEIKETFGVDPVPLQVPIGTGDDFTGVVSLLQRKALYYKTDGSGSYEKTDVPDDMAAEVEAAWEALVETVASTDDELLEKYLETFELTKDEVQGAFHDALKKGEILPVIFTAANKNVGIQALQDLITWAVPNPLERGSIAAVDADGNEHDVVVSTEGPYISQIIHTFVDEHSGKQSIFRIFTGTTPSDGQVKNPGRGQAERVGAIQALRGHHRVSVPQGVTGDILAVAKLKDSHTNDSLTAGTDLHMPPTLYPQPMMEYTITPAGKGDETKLKDALDRLLDEDPTLRLGYDDLSHKMVLRGMGQAHLDLSVDKMKRKFKVAVDTELPAVPYRETVRKKVTNVEGKHKKQTGGAGQFGVCYLDVEPMPKNHGFEFSDKIFGGAIPRQYIASVEKGIRARMKDGFLGGYPLVDVRVTLTDGKYHAVDSKDVAYQMAGSKGMKAAVAKAGIKLLEPVYKLEIVVPSDNMGDIMGDVTSRRGRILGMEPKGKKTIIQAVCPLAEMQRYAPDLRSMTGGQGTFTMEFEGYEDLPTNLVKKVVAASPFIKHDEDE